MPRARSPNRDKAFQLWIESQGRKSLQDIAAELGVKPEQVRSWKHADKWDAQTKKVALPMGKATLSNVSRERSAVIETLSAIKVERRPVIRIISGMARMSGSCSAY